MQDLPQNESSLRMDRRVAIKWMLAASAALPIMNKAAFGQSGPAIPTPQGIGFDPNLLAPGDLPWELTLSQQQLETLTALTDLILPKVGDSPSASELKVPDFIDEWVSAPYDKQREDRTIVLDGLQWTEAEAAKRFKKRFSQLTEAEQKKICDEVSYLPKAKPGYKKAAAQFAKIRNLTVGAYYTTTLGAREAGYVGNTPLPAFNGPPQAVLDQMGIDKAPW